ncbi:hypothetical protein BKA64DRAFT_707255 [Cadophora sp. MPI-SDFR-AT-0126]|nr:hypothetical protein BKA64DRAFT_707255 [Leotiomycetes sp. MPI-SDFR-AT-0126]
MAESDLTSSLSSARKAVQAAATARSSKFKSWFSHRHHSHSPLLSLKPLSQHGCHLLSALPPEIRDQIYQEVLQSFGTVQHITIREGKLTHMRCTAPELHDFFQDRRTRDSICNPYDMAFRSSVQNNWQIIPLFLTCKQVYQELIEAVYRSITFRIPSNAAKRFIMIVPDTFLACVRLHLMYGVSSPMYLKACDWPHQFTAENSNPKADQAEWEDLWRAFAKVRVAQLIVEIHDYGVRVPEQALMAPLRGLRQSPMEVLLPWHDDLDTSGDFRDVAYVVRRPPEWIDPTLQLDVDKGGPWLPKPRKIWDRLTKR